VRATYKGVLIEIERVRDGGWHWRLDKGEWSKEAFFVQADALRAAMAAVDALQEQQNR
jgi:hypothetical protein